MQWWMQCEAPMKRGMQRNQVVGARLVWDGGWKLSASSEQCGGAAALEGAQPRPAALGLASPYRLAVGQQAGAVAVVRRLIRRPRALLGADRGAVLAPKGVAGEVTRHSRGDRRHYRMHSGHSARMGNHPGNQQAPHLQHHLSRQPDRTCAAGQTPRPPSSPAGTRRRAGAPGRGHAHAVHAPPLSCRWSGWAARLAGKAGARETAT